MSEEFQFWAFVYIITATALPALWIVYVLIRDRITGREPHWSQEEIDAMCARVPQRNEHTETLK